jgi:hypothetical protein
VGVFGNDPINAEETGVGGVRELLRHPLSLFGHFFNNFLIIVI